MQNFIVIFSVCFLALCSALPQFHALDLQDKERRNANRKHYIFRSVKQIHIIHTRFVFTDSQSLMFTLHSQKEWVSGSASLATASVWIVVTMGSRRRSVPGGSVAGGRRTLWMCLGATIPKVSTANISFIITTAIQRTTTTERYTHVGCLVREPNHIVCRYNHGCL